MLKDEVMKGYAQTEGGVMNRVTLVGLQVARRVVSLAGLASADHHPDVGWQAAGAAVLLLARRWMSASAS